MIEIINIIYLLAGLTLIFAFPPKYILNFTGNDGGNLVETHSINIILVLTLFLLFSFSKLNLNFIFNFLAVFGFLNFFFYYQNVLVKKNYFFLIFLFFCFIISMKIATNLRLEWDAAVNWIYKTKNFYDGFDFSNLKNVPGVLSYPHLGTYGWALVWKNSLIDHEYAGRIFYVYIYLASIFLIINIFNFKFLSKTIIAFLVILLTFDHGLFSGYQEPLMFSLIIMLFILTKKASTFHKINIFHFFCILNANLILWVKNEGFVFLLIFLICLLFEKKTDKKIKLLFSASFISLILIKFFVFDFYFKENLIGWKGYEFLNFEKSISLENLKRLLLLFYQLIIIFFKYPIYLIFLLLFLFTLVKKINKYEHMKYMLFFLANCILSILIFFLTDDVKWNFHASVGMDRIMYSTSGIYLIFILDILKNYFLKIGKRS
ncbi:hypothetical protein MCEGEM12_00217 [Candidatus Pelagibacterales bacterium]